jgi:predicted metal-dependent peptidase
MTTVESIEELLAAPRLWAVTASPYLANVLFSLTPVETPGLGTFAVDRQWRLYVDRSCFDAWTTEEAGAVLIHEAHHVLRDHAGRADQIGVGPEDTKRFNIAGDCEINDDLLDLPLPATPCVPEAYGLEPGGLVEGYFQALDRPDGGWGDCGSGAHGQRRPWELPHEGGVHDGEAELIRQQTALAIAQAARAGRDMPSGLKRWADGFLRPQVDWRRVMTAAVRTGLALVGGNVDYSYSRPNRRTVMSSGPRVVMPALVSPVPRIAVIVDTSASMDAILLGHVLGEVEALLRVAGLAEREIAVLSCDTAVHSTQRVFSARQIELFGGGGTDLGVGLSAATALRPRPQVAVVLTDGYTPWPAERPQLDRVVVGVLGTPQGTEPAWALVVPIEPTPR